MGIYKVNAGRLPHPQNKAYMLNGLAKDVHGSARPR